MSDMMDPSHNLGRNIQNSLCSERIPLGMGGIGRGRAPSMHSRSDDDEESIRIAPGLSSASHHSRTHNPVVLPTIQSYISKHHAHHQRRSPQPSLGNPSEPPPPSAESEVCSPDTPNQLYVARQAGIAARERFDMLQRTSQLTHQPTDLLLMSWDEVFVEELLGMGGFACVCLVTCPKLWKKHKRTYLQRKWNNSQHQHSGDLASVDSSLLPPSEDSWMSCSVETNEEKYYACKCLSGRTIQQGYIESNSPNRDNGSPGAGNRNLFSAAAADLVGEAFLLSKMSHPNIVRLYGVTEGNVDEAFLHKGGFFLIMEALTSVLDDMLQAWRNLKQGQITSVGDFLRHSTEQIPCVGERLAIAMEIAKGMQYCHSQRIIFRDLKPHNVGTDRDGGLRLFDFGLAREAPSGVCRGKAGSLRYMAPETIANKFTCFASDVYAFGIVMWELMSLERPPNQNNELWNIPNDFERAVCIDGFRPPLTANVIENVAVRELIGSCWQEDFQQRPTFERIIISLQELLDAGVNQRGWGRNSRRDPSNSRPRNGLGNDGDNNLNGNSRHSTASSFQSLMNGSLMTDGSQSKMSAITMESARAGRPRSNRQQPPPPKANVVKMEVCNPPQRRPSKEPSPPPKADVVKMEVCNPPQRRPSKGPRKAPPQRSESETTVTVRNTAHNPTTDVQPIFGRAKSFQSTYGRNSDANLDENQQRDGTSQVVSSDMDESCQEGGTYPYRAPTRRHSDQNVQMRNRQLVQQNGFVRPPVFVRAKRKCAVSSTSGSSVASGTSERTSESHGSFASSYGSVDLDDTRASITSLTGSSIPDPKKGAIQWQRRRKPARPLNSMGSSPTPRSHSGPSSLMTMMSNSQKY